MSIFIFLIKMKIIASNFSKIFWVFVQFYKNHFNFQKKIRGRPKNFKIRLTESKNRGSKIMKFYAYYNLEIEPN